MLTSFLRHSRYRDVAASRKPKANWFICYPNVKTMVNNELPLLKERITGIRKDPPSSSYIKSAISKDGDLWERQ